MKLYEVGSDIRNSFYFDRDSEKDLLLPHSEPKKNFDDYKYCDDGPNKLSVCGEGRYGSVHRVENKTTGETFAMKIFRPNNNNNYQMWQKEYEHLRKVILPRPKTHFLKD